jgi:HEAT repeat protein
VRKAAAQQFNDSGWRPPAEALGSLRAALADTSPIVRSRVADVLGRCGPRAAEAVPELLANLTHKSAEARLTAAQALGQLGTDNASVLEALVTASADESDAVAAAAVTSLAGWSRLPGEVAGPLLRCLQRARGSDNPWPLHPSVAYSAMAKVEAPTAEVIDALRLGVVGRDTVEIDNACHALGALGPAAAVAVPELAELARTGGQVRSAVQALLRIGGDGVARVAELLRGERGRVILWEVRQLPKDALPLLPALLQRLRAAAAPNDRVEILDAIRPLWSQGAAAIPVLLEVVEGPAGADEQVGARALEALAGVGAELRPHCPRLIALSRRQDINPVVRCHVAGILARFADNVPEALDRVREMAREAAPAEGDDAARQWGKSLVRQCVAGGLASLPRAPVAALPEVAPLIDDTDNNTRAAAVAALKAMHDPAVIPHLCRAASHEDGWVRSKAVEALAATGDTSEATVAAVLAVLRDENHYLRRAGIAALVALKPGGAAVRQALRTASKDADSVVRRRAAALLKRVEGRKG